MYSKIFACLCLLLVVVVSSGLVLSNRRESPQCVLTSDPLELNVGEVKQAPFAFEFAIRNNGQKAVNLRPLASACACTSVNFSKTLLQPDDAATLFGELDAAQLRPGVIRWPIRFEYECAGTWLESQAMVVGVSVPHVTVSPDSIRFREDDVPLKVIRCTTNYSPAVSITDVSSSSPDIIASIENSAGVAILVSMNPNMNNDGLEKSIRQAEIVVKTTSSAIPEFRVPVTYIGCRNASSE